MRKTKQAPSIAHTPGPWSTGTNGDECAKGHAICAGGYVIGKVYGRGYPATKGWSPTSQADATLIAAAPELLAVLRGILADSSGCPMCDAGTLRNRAKSHWPECPYLAAHAAIAKAEGR